MYIPQKIAKQACIVTGSCLKRNNSTFRKSLRYALDRCQFEDSKDVQFAPYYIRSATLESSFSRGPLHMSPLFMDKEGNPADPLRVNLNDDLISYRVSFSSLFREGLQKLYKCIEGEDVEDNLLLPIGAFTKFIAEKDFHESSLLSLFANNSVVNETGLATILAVHLFSQLALKDEPSYMVTNDYHSKYIMCPCDNQCGKQVLYGNTSIGTTALWYGKPDIVLFPNGVGSSSVVVPGKDCNLLKNFNDEDVQMVEVKCDSSALRETQNIRQFSSIAMTFSYYQRIVQERIMRRRDPDLNNPTQPVYLIPTIAVTPECFDIYMYDTENDIFLRNIGPPIRLWSFDQNENKFSLELSSVLYIWMLINHLSFRPSFTNDVIYMLKGNCGMNKAISKERLQMIENYIRMPWSNVHNIDEDLMARAKKVELGKDESRKK